MLKKIILMVSLALLYTGCASVPPVQDMRQVGQIKQFNPPSADHAALYLFRSNSAFGSALKKDLWVDGKCIGETARGTFFYKEVMGNQEHQISTESEFGPNHLNLYTETGKNYFVQQYIKLGVFVGGANLKIVDEQAGQQMVQNLTLAESGHCSKSSLTD